MKTHELQANLARLGLDCGPLDGIKGPRTQGSILDFYNDFNANTAATTPLAELLPEIVSLHNDAVKRPVLDDLNRLGPFSRKWMSALNGALRFACITPDRLPAFLCELAVETAGFTDLNQLAELQKNRALYERFEIAPLREGPLLGVGERARHVFKIAALEWLDAGMNHAVDAGQYPMMLRAVEDPAERANWLSWLERCEATFGVVPDASNRSEDDQAPELDADELPSADSASDDEAPPVDESLADEAPLVDEPLAGEGPESPRKRLVFIDVQHAGKPPSRMRDRGATADLNHNGVIEVEELEAQWTAIIAFHLELMLLQAGYAVIRISDGWYRDRHERVNAYSEEAAEMGYAAQVYLALHLNSLIGGQPSDQSGKYSSFFFDARSAPHNGPKLAALIAESMTDELAQWYATPASKLPFHLDPAELHRQTPDVRAIPASASGWTKNAYHTIRGIQRPVAICVEPYFMDQIHHPISESGMKRAARALFEGIHAWAGTKEQT